jgi:hypothetical protein
MIEISIQAKYYDCLLKKKDIIKNNLKLYAGKPNIE